MEKDSVVLHGGYLKDGFIPVTVTIILMDDSSVLLKFSNREDSYIINAHRLVDSILFLSK
jgi:hypothetical protein